MASQLQHQCRGRVSINLYILKDMDSWVDYELLTSGGFSLILAIASSTCSAGILGPHDDMGSSMSLSSAG